MRVVSLVPLDQNAKGTVMGFRRLRARLDDLQANANQTMSEAQQLLHLAQMFIEEITDGVDFVATMKDSKTGEITEFPIGIRMKPKGEDQAKDESVTTQ